MEAGKHRWGRPDDAGHLASRGQAMNEWKRWGRPACLHSLKFAALPVCVRQHGQHLQRKCRHACYGPGKTDAWLRPNSSSFLHWWQIQASYQLTSRKDILPIDSSTKAKVIFIPQVKSNKYSYKDIIHAFPVHIILASLFMLIGAELRSRLWTKLWNFSYCSAL
jgi:hypothetical protein